MSKRQQYQLIRTYFLSDGGKETAGGVFTREVPLGPTTCEVRCAYAADVGAFEVKMNILPTELTTGNACDFADALVEAFNVATRWQDRANILSATPDELAAILAS